MCYNVYSSGLAIKPLVESMNKFTYGGKIDSFVKDTLNESKQLTSFISCE
jgi:hypothetical protein